MADPEHAVRALPGSPADMQIGYFLASEEHSPGDLVDQARRATPVGPDLDQHVESLRQYADAGVDELFVQQIGPEKDAFFDTWAREVLPRFA